MDMMFHFVTVVIVELYLKSADDAARRYEQWKEAL